MAEWGCAQNDWNSPPGRESFFPSQRELLRIIFWIVHKSNFLDYPLPIYWNWFVILSRRIKEYSVSSLWQFFFLTFWNLRTQKKIDCMEKIFPLIRKTLKNTMKINSKIRNRKKYLQILYSFLFYPKSKNFLIKHNLIRICIEHIQSLISCFLKFTKKKEIGYMEKYFH